MPSPARPPVTAPGDGPDAPAQPALSDLNLLPRHVHHLRVLGMALAMPLIAAVLGERGAPWPLWALLLFTGLAWPQLARWHARRAADPYRAELRNLLVDSVFAGLWVPLMHFNLLPSVLLVTLSTVDKIHTGIRGLWWRALPGMLLAGLVGGLWTGFAVQSETSTTVLLACLPMLLIHTIVVSFNSYRLVRKVQRQNRQLDELSRIDMLTGLDGRGHWEGRAVRALHAARDGRQACCLAMVDVDGFKSFNDTHGHAVGDDVLRLIAAVVRRALPAGDHGGRFGGDEFALLLQGDCAQAGRVAERIRAGVEQLVLPHVPGLRCSVSIGVAPADGRLADLREWVEAADRALYRAKSAGRNRVAVPSCDEDLQVAAPAAVG